MDIGRSTLHSSRVNLRKISPLHPAAEYLVPFLPPSPLAVSSPSSPSSPLSSTDPLRDFEQAEIDRFVDDEEFGDGDVGRDRAPQSQVRLKVG